MGINDAAVSLGFRSKAVALSMSQFVDEVKLPCIVHWNQNHFVVVYRIVRKRNGLKICVSDPAVGRIVYTQEQFLKSWASDRDEDTQESCGIAMTLEPEQAFYDANDDKDAGRLSNVLKYLSPFRKSTVCLLLLMALGGAINLVLPFLTQSVIDRGIGTGDLHFVTVILIAQMALTLGQLGNDIVRSRIMLHATTRISISLISDFLAKLMRLPIAFFDSKLTGDIMQRIGDHNRIQTFLTGSLLGIIMAVLTLLVYSIVMGTYSMGILGVFFIGSVIYVCWVLLFLRRRRKLDFLRFQEAAANQSNIVQLISGMQEVKLNGCEERKRREWECIQERLYEISVRSLSLGQTQQAGGVFIDQVKNVLVSFLAAKAVIDGNMTLGMMTAMQYIIGQLNAPVAQFIKFIQEAQDAGLSMERLGEIHSRADEESVDGKYIREVPENADIEFSDVSFQYNGPHSETVLDRVTVTIPHDKVTAIVGASGSGKTTMMKMMLGFYRPAAGSVTIAGRPISDYSLSAWRRICGTVMQDGYIFSDSIAANIALADNEADMDRVLASANVANIDGYVSQLPLQYNTKIGTEGNGISSGQRQRILIARAAYRDPRYLFLDEATNSLDADNEKAIMEKLSKFFKNRTVVVIAHRLSTVRNADNIIVLDHGRVAEQGSHSELVSRRGKYYQLVKNQLELGS